MQGGDVIEVDHIFTKGRAHLTFCRVSFAYFLRLLLSQSLMSNLDRLGEYLFLVVVTRRREITPTP